MLEDNGIDFEAPVALLLSAIVVALVYLMKGSWFPKCPKCDRTGIHTMSGKSGRVQMWVCPHCDHRYYEDLQLGIRREVDSLDGE